MNPRCNPEFARPGTSRQPPCRVHICRDPLEEFLMAKIRLYSPVGEEAPHAEGIVPLKDPRGSRVAFLFNGHVSVIPFWRHLEEELKLACEPADTVSFRQTQHLRSGWRVDHPGIVTGGFGPGWRLRLRLLHFRLRARRDKPGAVRECQRW